MLEKIKSNEPLYRALRTFIQAFVSSFLVTCGANNFEKIDKNAIVSLIISALASGISAVMNIKKTEVEDVIENPEKEEDID